MRFSDRAGAGRELALRLEPFRAERPVVLGVTNGGLAVGAEVADALGAPLEPLVVRKLGAPECPEFALGALAEGGGAYVDPDALLEAGLRDADVEAIAAREGAELARRVRRFRGERPFPDLHGRTAIVVDDGVGTGATARAAARGVRGAGAGRVVLAAPVVAAESAPGLREDFDEVVSVVAPEPFLSVGVLYDRFGEVSDEDALALLRKRRAPPGPDGPGASHAAPPGR